ncbi:M3 family metallopeptidase [Aquabacterium sp. OR-4]|uniref:M3 family metallopeptidase n=1 Tax=Aquabacterium sp. OR-4 TaxID=2978127 RepID=UPI0021B27791|nr:M3 family metallopeptidase [Aquabacterium sp. OR-4]MDT7835536.1 M3 family metallopeptidase [Aquabacterium sp. OR-4]
MQRPLNALLLALAGAACLAPTLATAANPDGLALPRDTGVDFPQYASAQALKTACDQGLTATQRALARIERRPADKGWLAAYDAFAAGVEDRANPITFVSAVHPDKAVREASEACELRWNDFYSSLGQNEKLYRAVQRLTSADETDRQLLKKLREDFEDAGVGLPPAQRARAKALNDKIAELGQSFDRNVRDANIKVVFTESELAGVPEGVWKKAPRDAEGRVQLGLSYPEFLPLMQTAESAAARERMWRAKQNEGGEANLKLLDEIVKLRKEYAGLFGAGSWAEFVIRRRMAESPQRVESFLADVKGAVQARERAELDELRRAKADHLGQPVDGLRFECWDLSYYTERLRKAKYSVDQEAFRQFFPPQESLAFTLRLVEKLMGVRYQRVQAAKAWHPEVQTYAVSDAASGKPLGLMRVDLYPREGKYNHAAVWPIRGASTQLKRSTQAHLVVNFDRKGLTLDELETLLHELGHAVHTNLSATRWAQHAGTSVQRDFVEAPSQMLEDWVFDARTLQLFAEVCPSCKPVPEALLAQAKAAHHYGKGVQASRQHLYASYDIALYGPEPRDAMALWAQMEGATPLGHVAGTRFPAGFGHIATGYSAGYYGYLWSLVVAADMRTAFAADKLDARVGRRYRDTVLANGSARPPAQLVRDFLGRDFNAQAFFEDLKK